MIPFVALFFFIKWSNWFVNKQGEPWPFLGVLALGAFVGGLIGLAIAGILISYVESVEQQIAEVNRYNKEYNKIYNQLINQGMDTDDAAAKAHSHASGSYGPCFIATVVYGSPNAEEVIYLQKWRDDWLLPCSIGRLFVKVYYFISPRIICAFEGSKLLRRYTKVLIDNLIIAMTSRRKNRSRRI